MDLIRHGRAKECGALRAEGWGISAPNPASTFSRPDLVIPCQVASPQSLTPFHQARGFYQEPFGCH